MGPSNRDKIWSADMLAHIPWASKFFSGPKDPLQNKFSAYCHICHMNISVKGKGHHAIIRHWRRERHFRREQRYRDSHGMDVLDRQMRVLTGHRLETERKEFSKAVEVTLSARNPYYGESSDDELPHTEPSTQRLKIQLQLLLDTIRGGEQVSTLKSVWRIVTAHLPHDEILSDVDFSEGRIVCLVQYLFNRLIETISDYVETDGRYSIVFEDVFGDRRVYITYWACGTLRTTLIFINDRLAGGKFLDVFVFSHLLAAIPNASLLVSCSGVQVEVIKTLDDYFHPRIGVLSSHCVTSSIIEQLVVRPDNIVFGRVDILSIVDYILTRLRGATDEEWLHQAPTLYQVSCFACYNL